MNLLFEGNKNRHPHLRVDFKHFNSDCVNKEQEKLLEDHFIKWYRHINNLPDSEDEDENA